MNKEQITREIKSYLDQEELDYWEGVELYSEHPAKRNNVILTLNQRWQKSAMHSKLVYELEKMVGEKSTNRSTKLNQRPAVLPYKVIDETKEKAPANYEYKIAYEDLPEELKAVVIEKGQLYNALELSKKNLADIGEQNDDKSVSKRAVILKDMRRMADRIIKIHSLLMFFDEKNGFAKNEEMKQETANKLAGEAKQFFDEIEGLKNTPVGGVKTNPDSQKEEELSVDDKLQAEFGHKDMTYWKLKDLQVKLRSSVLKQVQRAETSKKKNIKEKNLQKAELGRTMLEWLENYFEETPEPEK